MPKYLLYITDSEGIGGAEGYLLTLLRHVNRLCYRVGLVLPSSNEALADAAQAAGVVLHYFDHVHRDGLNVHAVRAAAHAFANAKPAIIHAVLASPRRCAEHLLGAWLAGVPRRIVTFQLVTPVPRFRGPMKLARKLNRAAQARTFHSAIAVSEGNAHLLRTQYDVPADRLHMIPNAVDTARFAPGADGAAQRAAWGIPADAPLLGLVGRINLTKGHAVLFNALPAIWAAHPNAHLALIGAGPLEEKLRAWTNGLARAAQVHFVGWCADMPQAYAALNIALLPSFHEGLPFAVLEALACGVPVVASDVDGSRELVTNDQTGLLVPPGDPHALAAAINRLLGDQTLRASLATAGRARVVATYDQRAMLERTFALYDERR